MQSARHGRSPTSGRIIFTFAYLLLGTTATVGQVDWGVIEGADIEAEEAIAPPPARPLAATDAPVAAPDSMAEVAAPDSKPAGKAVARRRRPGRQRGPSGYAYQPKRPELAREFPLESVDVATLLKVRSPRPGDGPAAGEAEHWVPAELPLVIDEPRPSIPVESAPAHMVSVSPVAIEEAPRTDLALPVADEAPARVLIEESPAAIEEPVAIIIEEPQPVEEPAAVEVTKAPPVVIDEAASLEPFVNDSGQQEQPLVIEESLPSEQLAPAIEEEEPLVIEATAPEGVAVDPSAQDEQVPVDEEQPLVIEEAAPH